MSTTPPPKDVSVDLAGQDEETSQMTETSAKSTASKTEAALKHPVLKATIEDHYNGDGVFTLDDGSQYAVDKTKAVAPVQGMNAVLLRQLCVKLKVQKQDGNRPRLVHECVWAINHAYNNPELYLAMKGETPTVNAYRLANVAFGDEDMK